MISSHSATQSFCHDRAIPFPPRLPKFADNDRLLKLARHHGYIAHPDPWAAVAGIVLIRDQDCAIQFGCVVRSQWWIWRGGDTLEQVQRSTVWRYCVGVPIVLVLV